MKKVINLNGDSRFTSPPSYSGWLGSCWFEEGKTEDRNRYIEQIKSEKISKIKSNSYYQLEVPKKQIDRVLEWDLLGINNLALGEKK